MVKKKTIKMMNTIALWLITLGAVNWGLEKVVEWNLIDTISNAIYPAMGIWIYSAIALSGAYALYLLLTKQLK